MRLRLTVEVEAGDVTLEMLRTYLLATGWREGSRWAEGPTFERADFVLHPPDDLANFGSDMEDAVQDAAAAERRSPLAVLADMRASWVRALLRERGVTCKVAAHEACGITVRVDSPENYHVFQWGRDIGPDTDWRAWADGVAAWWRS